MVPVSPYRPDYGGWQCTWPHGQKRLRVVGGTEHPDETGEPRDEPPSPSPQALQAGLLRRPKARARATLSGRRAYPVAGLVDVWGKAKCYKSFWTLDLMLHVAMGWEYRDRYVRQGPVVYCAFEGAHGYKKRVEALRRHYNMEPDADVPLYVMPGQANLIAEHRFLISDVAEQLGDVRPHWWSCSTLSIRALSGPRIRTSTWERMCARRRPSVTSLGALSLLSTTAATTTPGRGGTLPCRGSGRPTGRS